MQEKVSWGAAVSVALHRAVKSARKPKGEGHARRGEILAAAERIFLECGYEGATIRRIAEEVGLSSTALYMHFRDKSEMLLEICEQSFARLTQKHVEIRRRAVAPETKVREMLRAYMAFGLTNSNAYRLVFCTWPQGETDSTRTVAIRLGVQVFEQFEQLVEEIAATGRLKGDPQVVAQTMWAASHGLIALIITKPFFPWASADVLMDSLLDSLFEGAVLK
jgi:AcrR family transcriptional regulator